MNLIAISSCPSSFFSTNYLWVNIPSLVPLPCLNSTDFPLHYCSYSAIQILSSNVNIWLSNVMPQCFSGSCTSPFLFYIPTISPVLQSSVNFPSLSCRCSANFFGRSSSNSFSNRHRQHLYSHFTNACFSFQIGLHDKP